MSEVEKEVVQLGTEENPIKVSNKTNPKSVAGALAGLARDGHKKIEMSVIGAGSLNQAVKGVAIARGFLAPTGKDLIIVPSFSDIKIENEDRTSLKISVEVR